MGVNPKDDGPGGLGAVVSKGAPGGPSRGLTDMTGCAGGWEGAEAGELEGGVGGCSQRWESMLARAGRFLAACTQTARSLFNGVVTTPHSDHHPIQMRWQHMHTKTTLHSHPCQLLSALSCPSPPPDPPHTQITFLQ